LVSVFALPKGYSRFGQERIRHWDKDLHPLLSASAVALFSAPIRVIRVPSPPLATSLNQRCGAAFARAEHGGVDDLLTDAADRR
jgi:hypothetical protein